MSDAPQTTTKRKTSVIYNFAAGLIILLGIALGIFAFDTLRELELQEQEHRVEQKISAANNTFRNEISKYYFTLHGLAKVLMHPHLEKEARQSLWQRITQSPNSARRNNDIALKDVYYISYDDTKTDGISCALEDAYLSKENAATPSLSHRHALAEKHDLCTIASAQKIFERVMVTRKPQLIALEDLNFPPILRKLDSLKEAREPALVYPFYDNKSELKGWIIGTIDLALIQQLLRENRIFGAHIDVYDISHLGIRPIMSNMPTFSKIPPLTQTKQIDGITRTLHAVPKNIRPIKDFPSEISYIHDGQYVIETQLFIAGRRLLLVASKPHDYTLYPSLVGAATCLIFVILALIIFTQSRVRDRADTLAKKIAKQLHASEDRLKAATEGSNDGIWDWDIENDTVWFSKRYYEILGYENNAFAPSYQAFKSRVHPEDIHIVANSLKAHLNEHKLYAPTFRMQHKQGHYIWIHSRGQARYSQGKAIRMAGVHTDISGEKAQQFELTKAQQKAESAAEVKALFLANMSHEIRTPLNGIVGISELLAQTDLNGKQTQYVDTLQDSCDTLMQIVNDILDYSKLEAKKMPLENIPFSLPSTLENTLALSLPAIEKRENLELIYRYAPTLPQQFVGDPTRIRQIVMNLLSNAIKFTETGYVLIDVDGAVSTTDKNIYDLSITVEDTGLGMDAETRKNLFDKFTQADDSTTRKYGGTGLGLSIIHELVKLLGGDITLESQPNKGSMFTTKFSLHLADEQEPPLVTEECLLDSRILIVDTQPKTISILKEALEAHGAYVDGCTASESAISLMEEQASAGFPYKIIILNHTMAPISGPKLALEIKQNTAIRDAHLVLITSQSRKGDGKKMRALEFEAYLSKPLFSEHLCFAVSSILRAAAQNQGPVFITRHSYTEHNQLDGASTALQNDSLLPESNILVVEDNKTNQQIMAWLLDDIGAQYHIVENGQKALDALDNIPNINLIIMDCHMPVMDGLTATRIIRQRNDALAALPIIALSANNQPSDRDECLKAGMNAFVSKPIDRDELIKIITHTLPDLVVNTPSTFRAPFTKPPHNNDVLDSKKLLDLTSGAKALTEKFLAMFNDSVNEGVQGMRDALQHNDPKQLKLHAHSLKGAAANLSANEMCHIAETLESLPPQGGWATQAEKHMNAFLIAHDRFQEATQALLTTLHDD